MVSPARVAGCFPNRHGEPASNHNQPSRASNFYPNAGEQRLVTTSIHVLFPRFNYSDTTVVAGIGVRGGGQQDNETISILISSCLERARVGVANVCPLPNPRAVPNRKNLRISSKPISGSFQHRHNRIKKLEFRYHYRYN